MSRRGISKKMIHTITKHRISTLFTLARKQAKKGNFHLANRYITHARNLSMKNTTAIPSHLKHQYCNHCYSYFYPPTTCTIRIRHGSIIKQCHHCNKITRIPFK